MSRLPSFLETSLPQPSIGANTAPGLPRQSLLQQLTAPGVVPVARQSNAGTSLRQVLAALGGVGELAQQVGHIADDQRRGIEKEVREEMIEAEKRGELGVPLDKTITHPKIIETYRLSKSGFDAGKRAAEIEALYQTGELSALIGSEGDIAKLVTNEIVTYGEGKSEIEIARYGRDLGAGLRPILGRVREDLRVKTVNDLVSTNGAAMVAKAKIGGLTTDEANDMIDRHIQAVKGLRVNEQEAIAQLVPAIQAVADSGNADAIKAVLPRIEKSFPDMAPALERRVNAVIAQAKQQGERDVTAAFERITQKGDRPYGQVEFFLDLAVKDGKISHVKRTEMAGHYALKQARKLAMDADYRSIDGLIAVGPKDEDAQFTLKQYRQQAIATHQRNFLNDRLEGVVTGRLDALDTIKEFGARLQAGRNPDNPEGISVDQYRAAVNAIESGMMKVSESMIRKEQLIGGFTKPGTIAATPEDDRDILSLFGAMGLANAQGEGEKLIFRGVTKPEAAARLAESVGRVPKQWQDSIATAFNGANADSDGLQLAMRSYAALALRNPSLAAQVYTGLNDTGKVRADALMIEIERGHQLAVNDQTGEPNREWVERIAGLTPTILNAKPVNLKAPELTTMLWGEKADIQSAADREIGRVLPAALQKSKFLFWTTQDLTVSPIVANDYADFTRERLSAQLAAGVPARKAIENAKALAADDLLAKHPPVLWNGTVSIGGAAPHMFTVEHEAELVIDIVSKMPNDMKPAYLAGDNEVAKTMQKTMTKEAMARAALRESGFSHILTQARPVWDRSFGASGAWVLRDDNGNNVVINGQEFGFIPTVPDQPSVKQLREKYEREARKREAEVQDFISRHNVN